MTNSKVLLNNCFLELVQKTIIFSYFSLLSLSCLTFSHKPESMYSHEVQVTFFSCISCRLKLTLNSSLRISDTFLDTLRTFDTLDTLIHYTYLIHQIHLNSMTSGGLAVVVLDTRGLLESLISLYTDLMSICFKTKSGFITERYGISVGQQP